MQRQSGKSATTARNTAPRPFSLDGLIERHLPPSLTRLVQPPLERLLALQRLERWYAEMPATRSDTEFLTRALERFQVDYRVTCGGLEAIPRTGPLVVVANHPFGGIEGMIMALMLRRVRDDVRIMANELLQRIPELRDLFIGVDPFGGPAARGRNLQPLREGLKTLQAGGCLVIFPAGEVSHLDLRRRVISDPAWSDHAAKLARRSGAPVLPVYFHGANSWMFQALGLVNPHLRTVLLPRELVNKCRKTITLSVGQPVEPARLAAFGDNAACTGQLRLRTYLLGGTAERGRWRLRPVHGSAPEPIARPVDPAHLARDVGALPPECLLLRNGELEVYAALARQIPNLLHEIGRLRELTFRATGEGTGRPEDLDAHDRYYTHLFIWNAATGEVVGAYRLGFADTILARHGRQGLYSHTLFRYRRTLLERINPAIELGRSFVRAEYQKSYSALMLLWKGIGALIARNPRYTTLFGPVSISNAYQSVSQRLLVDFLSANTLLPDHARLVRPRRPFRGGRDSLAAAGSRAPGDLEAVGELVASLEPDRKGIPVLLRQYLKMGGQLLAFNVDPAFNDALDGLIMMDLRRADPKVLARYMGREAAAAFLAYHHIDTDRTGLAA